MQDGVTEDRGEAGGLEQPGDASCGLRLVGCAAQGVGGDFEVDLQNAGVGMVGHAAVVAFRGDSQKRWTRLLTAALGVDLA